MSKKRFMDFGEYRQLSEADKQHVTVINFTGLTELVNDVTLGVEQSEGGSSEPSGEAGKE